MSKIAVVTDNNSGFTQETAAQAGVYLVHMPFTIDGEQYFEGINITQKEFFEKIADPKVSVATSQPSPEDVTGMWDKCLQDHDEVVYIPMSSGLSGSCQTAIMLSQDYGGRVQVVNNQRISVTMYQSCLDALALADKGMNAQQIKDKLEEEKFESSIYIMVDTLSYLKRGGRVTPAAALIGTVLHIKPVLQIQGEKLDAYAKARGVKQGKKIMLDAIRKDMETRFRKYADEGTLRISYSYTYSEDMSAVEQWVDEIRAAFPGYEPTGDPLSLSIGCHIGPGSLAVTCQHILTD